ncbi:hypothetical protein FOZ61_001226 [Perkinsus olseni]|uniref:Peptidase A1 domain-containing protein n=2 Tax=Perkinsus olseni TaxID=32597 RepID=A0A7J6KQT2_PEROL|nr:hypothetical protein FOZ61_001226 [Perkinsus olseni]
MSTGSPKTLIDQMVSKKVIDTDAFSLHLATEEHAAGKLILGGDDPDSYQEPMRFALVVDTTYVTLTGFNIGGDAYPRVQVESRAYPDTGADVIAVPGLKSSWSLWFIPSLPAGVDGFDVPLVITPDAYVEPKPKPGGKDCILLVDDDPDNEWTIGHPALLGKYFSFRWGEKKIGIAELK